MNFFDLNDDKSVIAKDCTSDYFISAMFVHQDLQKLLFGEMAFDNDFRKIRKNTG